MHLKEALTLTKKLIYWSSRTNGIGSSKRYNIWRKSTTLMENALKDSDLMVDNSIGLGDFPNVLSFRSSIVSFVCINPTVVIYKE